MTVPTRDPIEEAKAWNEVVPGTAEKVWAEHAASLTHRHRIETAMVVFRFFGPVLGAIVVLVVLFTGVWLVYSGHSTEGALIITIDLVGFFLALLFMLRMVGRPSA